MFKILAPIDFSDVSQSVIDQAARLAEAMNGRLVLLHVVPNESVAAVGEAVWVESPAVPEADLPGRFPQEFAKLNEMANAARDKGIETDAMMMQGMPMDQILEAMTTQEADLVVMGSHGHSALYELIVGSVTELVLRHSTKPVVVVPAVGRRGKLRSRPKWEEQLATPF